FGLLPKDGAHSMQQYTTNYYPFVFGKQLNTDQGYLTLAVHGGSYTYYDRDKSLPNMGYDFYAADHGITLINPTYWPTSDVELVDAVADKFIGQPQPFNVYYMTISGHQYYTFSGNMMSYKHENDVAGLPYSEGPRAYIACQMEFDQAVKDLIDRLTAAGEMDNTVLVISGDHYPYGLQDGQDISKLEELAGGPIDQDFELYHSTLIIWSGDMKEPIEVDKPCYSIDLLPTLSNLFGLPYDSRLLMGHDILSDSAPLVVFSNRSFITDKGRYNARTDTFTPADGADFGSQTPDDYAKQMLSQVQAMFKYSGAILDNDYYKHVLG
ncbi:MAG: sulfatase-like hydrolase/transferase, partial [Firmicutes bacterium]|nr:sulfatase-like hydrolase/transferase [Bacillota bacterium]